MEGITTEDQSSNQTTVITPIRCPVAPPRITEYLPALSNDYIIAFGVLGAITLVLVINYLEELYYLYRHHSPLQGRSKAKWLLCVYPITGLTSLVTLIAPRLTYINDLVAIMYVCFCVHVFVVMIIDQYGGPLKMLRQLRGRKLRLNPKPLCCCVCLPEFTVERVHLQIIHAMVLQFVIVRPIITYILTVMWSDGTFGSTNNALISPQTYIQIINIVSTLIAMYGFMLVKDQSMKLLSNINLGAKFYSLQLVLMIIGIQRSVVLIVIVSLGIPCIPPLNFESTVDRYHHMITICEMTVLSCVARFYYRHTAQAMMGQIAPKYRRKTTSFMVELERENAADQQPEIIRSERSVTASESSSDADTVAQDELVNEIAKEPPHFDDNSCDLQNSTKSKRTRKISFVENDNFKLSHLKDEAAESTWPV